MTPEQLDEIEKLAGAATPGPWEPYIGVDYGMAAKYYACGPYHASLEFAEFPLPSLDDGNGKDRAENDAAFIVAMREYALPLVKAVRDERRLCKDVMAERDAALRRQVELKERWSAVLKERDEARAEVERLTHNLVQTERHAQLVEKSLADSQAEIERRTDWYQQRFNALRPWVENEVAPLSPEVVKRYWNIVANGSPSPHESADWAGTLHAAKVGAHVAGVRADNAERREAHLKTELDEARAEVERLREEVRQVHALADRGVSDWPAHIPLYALIEIHKITKGMVE